MRTKILKQSNILISYENHWVALSPTGDEVRAFGATLKAVNKKLESIGDKDAVLTYVLPFNKTYSPMELNNEILLCTYSTTELQRGNYW